MKIAIIGLGLIGGSLGRSLVKKTNHEVFAYDVDKSALKLGELLGAFKVELNEENIKDIDFLILSLYQGSVLKVLPEYLSKLKKGAVIMDICGNKRTICAKMKEFAKTYPHLEFISSHPMAGREFSGIKHSSINLFDKASMILVPVKADIRTLKKVKELSYEIGFTKVVITTDVEHDKIIAFTSQLAHVISSAYIKSPTANEFLGFSAGSFRDMTRVARLSPKMWTELMIDNKDNLVREIDCLIKNLTDYKLAIEKGDTKVLYDLLEDGNQKKQIYEKLKNKKTD